MVRVQSYEERQVVNKRLAAAKQNNERCYICGQPIDYSIVNRRRADAASIDHIKSWRDHPELRTDVGNLAPAHRACNTSKGVKDSALPAHGNASRDWSGPQ